MTPLFSEFTIVIVLAAVLGIVARMLRQPTIVAYLAAGVIVGSFNILQSGSLEIFDVMATLGITLLLFIVGLQIKLDNLKIVGKAALIAGTGQIAFTALIGFAMVRWLGFATLPSVYIAFALTFSSTIIVIKLLTQKRDLQSLYGRIVIGFLIVQDVVAIFVIMFLGGFEPGTDSLQLQSLFPTITKSLILFGGTIWLSHKVFPWIFAKLARTPELVFITSIAWAFGVSLFVSSEFIGLSVEIGGFLAGISLAKSIEQYQIESQLRPLRDFFIVIFFVVLGSSLVLSNIGDIITPAIILSLFVLVGNPLIVLILMGFLGFRKKTNFYASITVAQISEFGLILMAMGLAQGHVSKSEVSLVTLIGVITITVSTYMILNSHKIFLKIKNILNIFEKKNPQEEIPLPPNTKGPIILAGANRLGAHLLRSIEKQKLVVVEYDPEIVKKLRKKKYKVLYGDITEIDIQEQVHLEQAHIFISTIPDIDDNLMLLDSFRVMKMAQKHLPIVIVTAYTNFEARQLYSAGADYVIMPHFLGGMHLASLLKEGVVDQIMMNNWKKHDRKILREN